MELNFVIEIFWWLGYTILTLGSQFINAVKQSIVELEPLTEMASISYGQIILADLGITEVAATIVLLLIGLISPKVKKALDKGPF